MIRETKVQDGENMSEIILPGEFLYYLACPI